MGEEASLLCLVITVRNVRSRAADRVLTDSVQFCRTRTSHGVCRDDSSDWGVIAVVMWSLNRQPGTRPLTSASQSLTTYLILCIKSISV